MSEDSNERRTNKGKAGRKQTGTLLLLDDGRYQARVYLCDGVRTRLPPYPAGTSEEVAEKLMANDIARIKRDNIVSGKAEVERQRTAVAVEASTLACGEWVKAWQAARVRKGLASADKGLSHWNHHLSAVLGSKHPKDWTRDDFRRLSASLDSKVQRLEISAKSAQNIWGTATKMADDAMSAKTDDIRVRDDNAAMNVQGPDRGSRRQRPTCTRRNFSPS